MSTASDVSSPFSSTHLCRKSDVDQPHESYQHGYLRRCREQRLVSRSCSLLLSRDERGPEAQIVSPPEQMQSRLPATHPEPLEGQRPDRRAAGRWHLVSRRGPISPYQP